MLPSTAFRPQFLASGYNSTSASDINIFHSPVSFLFSFFFLLFVRRHDNNPCCSNIPEPPLTWTVRSMMSVKLFERQLCHRENLIANTALLLFAPCCVRACGLSVMGPWVAERGVGSGLDISVAEGRILGLD